MVILHDTEPVDQLWYREAVADFGLPTKFVEGIHRKLVANLLESGGIFPKIGDQLVLLVDLLNQRRKPRNNVVRIGHVRRSGHVTSPQVKRLPTVLI